MSWVGLNKARLWISLYRGLNWQSQSESGGWISGSVRWSVKRLSAILMWFRITSGKLNFNVSSNIMLSKCRTRQSWQDWSILQTSSSQQSIEQLSLPSVSWWASWEDGDSSWQGICPMVELLVSKLSDTDASKPAIGLQSSDNTRTNCEIYFFKIVLYKLTILLKYNITYIKTHIDLCQYNND